MTRMPDVGSCGIVVASQFTFLTSFAVYQVSHDYGCNWKFILDWRGLSTPRFLVDRTLHEGFG